MESLLPNKNLQAKLKIREIVLSQTTDPFHRALPVKIQGEKLSKCEDSGDSLNSAMD